MKPGRRFQDTLAAVKHGAWNHGKINIDDDNERERERIKSKRSTKGSGKALGIKRNLF